MTESIFQLLAVLLVLVLFAIAHENDIIKECKNTGYADVSLWANDKIKCSLEK